MNEVTWPEPIAAASDQTAASAVRQLWSKAEQVDAVVADANQLRVIIDDSMVNSPRAVRIITGNVPLTAGAAPWRFTIIRQRPNPEFILFYPAGCTFPESALMFTGGMGNQGWVTFHQRPLVLHRLRERFNRLFTGEQQPLAVAASVREQPLKPRPAPGTGDPLTSEEPELVAPAELYRRVLAAHFTGLEGHDDTARPDSAPVLATHQERAYERARDIIDRYGGVIIADAVGLGKTYIGLRLLERVLEAGGRALVIVPAALRHQWERELSYLGVVPGTRSGRSVMPSCPPADDNLDLWVREGRNVELLSMESLGRRAFNASSYRGADLVLVDEAHNFRNHATRRYWTLADLVRHSKVAFLTATPINNTIFDLQHLLDLFAAPGAFRHLGIPDYRSVFRRVAAGDAVGDGDVRSIISACVLRRTRRFLGAHYGEIKLRDPHSDGDLQLRFPKRLPPVAVDYDLAGTYSDLFAGLEDWLSALRFPFINPRTDDAIDDKALACSGELLKIILLKRLESSIEAFRCTVIQQLAWCNTALGAIKAGRVLTRPDYRAVFKGPDDDPGSQLAFFELMLPAPSMEPARVSEFRGALEHDMQILARVHTALSAVGPLGDSKLQKLIQLLDGPLADRKVLIFTEFRDTAHYIYHALKHRPYLAQIDSQDARLGLDRANRREVIERFAPRSNGLPEPPRRERVDLLIATDVLSEGLNLQDASVVVSYDLPWNPVRLMQRIGRVDRLGALAETVELYHFVPADVLDRLLGLMSRLQSKVTTINTALGLEGPVLAASAGGDRTIDQIRVLAQDPRGYDRVERELEGPLDPEEQAYLDYVNIQDGRQAPPPQAAHVAASAVAHSGRQGSRAISYWRVSCDGKDRGLWLVCDLENGCVVEDQATALEMLRDASAWKTRKVGKRVLDNARRACERYARSVLARLEATRIAGDALSPSLPQCRIAAWLSRGLQTGAHRLTHEQRKTIDGLLDRLARRFTLAGERALAVLAQELPQRLDMAVVNRLNDRLRGFESESRGSATLKEVATLIMVSR